MSRVTTDSFDRPADLTNRADPNVLYARSYLLIRTLIGFLGISLPIGLFIGEATFLEGTAQVRGSLSAYYHSSMRDAFVACLCVIGLFLVTYMAGRADTWDYWLSLVAGIAVVGVAFFPTGRPALPPGAPACGTDPTPAGCVAMQQLLGETRTATIHYVCAGIFIVSLAVLARVFAVRERRYTDKGWLARLLTGCSIAIAAAIVWIAVGSVLDASVWRLTPLYVGEVMSVAAFATAWLAKSLDLWGAYLGSVFHLPRRVIAKVVSQQQH